MPLQTAASSATSSLSSHAASLATFAADMPAHTSLVDLSAALANADQALDRVPYGTALGDSFLTWMTGLR
jgi:hypothetical protein